MITHYFLSNRSSVGQPPQAALTQSLMEASLTFRQLVHNVWPETAEDFHLFQQNMWLNWTDSAQTDRKSSTNWPLASDSLLKWWVADDLLVSCSLSLRVYWTCVYVWQHTAAEFFSVFYKLRHILLIPFFPTLSAFSASKKSSSLTTAEHSSGL